jgi:16S rRNA (guanine1207-N2)-methyltransferase
VKVCVKAPSHASIACNAAHRDAINSHCIVGKTNLNAGNTSGGQDTALATLLLPFATGTLTWPDARVLFVNARDGWPLHAVPRQLIVCVQDFKPHADALERGGLAVATRIDDETFQLVLFLPPRQRIEARAELARAVQRTAIGGTVVASIANNEGARSGEADMQRLLGPVQSISKNHCRVFWTQVRDEALDRALLDDWSYGDAPRPIADGRFVSRPGVFAWDRIDAASELLAAQLPNDLSGRGADLGAGFGYLSTEVLTRCPRVTSLDLCEADARALELARTNLAGANARRAAPAKLDFLWHDVAAGLPRRYDFIVTNPPFHVGRADEPQLGRAFIAAAADALDPSGRLWLVANRHLPYESILNERFATVRTVTNERGFKVIEATKANLPLPKGEGWGEGLAKR